MYMFFFWFYNNHTLIAVILLLLKNIKTFCIIICVGIYLIYFKIVSNLM